MRLIAFTVAVVLGLATAPARAHPHIFVDTSVQFLFNEAEDLAAVRIIWAYDELYSLLITEELGLDPDYDGILTPAEIEALSGFDMNWDEGFAGDTRGFAGEQPIALSRPVEWSAAFEDGKIITTHVRAFDQAIDPRDAEVVMRLYDPSFYTAYTALPTQLVQGTADCEAEAVAFDTDTAYAYLQAKLDEAEAKGADVELDFPAVGEAFADEVRLICGP